MGYCATHKVNYIYNGCYQCKSDRELIESQAKEIKGLREDKSKLTKLCSLLNYTALGFEKESENYSEILELWPQVMLRTFEMLDTTQPDTKQKD